MDDDDDDIDTLTFAAIMVALCCAAVGLAYIILEVVF